MSCRYQLKRLPIYLKESFFQASQISSGEDAEGYVELKTIPTIQQLSSIELQEAYLLLLRHHTTNQIAERGVLHPPTIIDRSRVYEALDFADLAAADAFVCYTLCETLLSEEWVSDLEPQELSGKEWSIDDKDTVRSCEVEALLILCRSLSSLGATKDSEQKYIELLNRYAELHPGKEDHEIRAEIQSRLAGSFCIRTTSSPESVSQSRFGVSRRQIYPWNEHEPYRNSSNSMEEINRMLVKVAPELEARVTALPALDNSTDFWYQLGLFSTVDIPPSAVILREKSVITAIRPLDDALCDACGADLESVSRDDMRQCPGVMCDTTFCSEDCASIAALQYHQPNIGHQEDEKEHDDYPPASAPFCNNTALQEIGRTSSTDAPEWDLYFLLLTRAIQMAFTRNIHPLDLPEIKFLWGDFGSPHSNHATLPFSLDHNIALPLQFFETLMHSVSLLRPYTQQWLTQYDWWILQTMFAKFRGVANAQQSTYDGKPEIAAVHPMWCLANHSCAPNVRWTPTGMRMFQVLEAEDRAATGHDVGSGDGIRAGEEIWSHYTDVRLQVEERRDRLKEVLGGICRCERCLHEANKM